MQLNCPFNYNVNNSDEVLSKPLHKSRYGSDSFKNNIYHIYKYTGYPELQLEIMQHNKKNAKA